MIRKLWGYRVDVLLLGLQADAATQPRVFVFQITVSVSDSSTVLLGSWAVRWSKSNRGTGNLLPFHLLLMLKPPVGSDSSVLPSRRCRAVSLCRLECISKQRIHQVLARRSRWRRGSACPGCAKCLVTQTIAALTACSLVLARRCERHLACVGHLGCPCARAVPAPLSLPCFT